MFQISRLLTVLLPVLVVSTRADVDINILQEENRLLAGIDNAQEKAIQYKSAGKTSISSCFPLERFLARIRVQDTRLFLTKEKNYLD